MAMRWGLLDGTDAFKPTGNFIKGKLAHDFNAKTFVRNNHIVLSVYETKDYGENNSTIMVL